MNKTELFRRIEESIKKEIARTEKARKDSQDDANKHKGKMASRYDTFKEEAQYMASAYEARLAELSSSLILVQGLLENIQTVQTTKSVRVGSVVFLQSEGGEKNCYLLAPAGGGIQFMTEDIEISVVTPSSPIGRALLGKKIGDKIKIQTQDGANAHDIMEVI